MEVDNRLRRFNAHVHLSQRFLGRFVRRQHDVVEFEQGVVRTNRLDLEHVESRRREWSGSKRLHQIGFHHQTAARRVDQHAACFHLAKGVSIEQPARAFHHRCMDAHDIGSGQQRVEIHQFDIVLGGKLRIGQRIECQHLHAKRLCSRHHTASDTSQADQAQRAASQRSTDRGVPSAAADQPVVMHDVSRDRQHQHQCLLRNGFVIGRGRDGDGDLVTSRGRNVDAVVPHARSSDDSQFGQ